MSTEKEKIAFKKDAQDNALYIEGNHIFLQTAKDKHKHIASFDIEKKWLVVNKEHYDYNERFKCYPFNEAVLRVAKKCDTVHLICPEGKFDIPIEAILKYGSPLIYPTFGLTNQLYIEVALIKKYPAR